MKASGSMVVGWSLTWPSPSSTARHTPSARWGEVHGDEGQVQGGDQRRDRGEVDLDGLKVVRGVRVRADQRAGPVDPPGAYLGGGEVFEAA
jgi:hypothetical protein